MSTESSTFVIIDTATDRVCGKAYTRLLRARRQAKCLNRSAGSLEVNRERGQ